MFAAAELPGSVVLLLGVAGDGVENLPKLCLLGQSVDEVSFLSL